MMKTSLHLTAGSVLTFNCPSSGPLYDQVAGIVTRMGETPKEETQHVELPLLDCNNVTIALKDVLAVETSPPHTFPHSPELILMAAVRRKSTRPESIPEESAPGPAVKMTIGMATYDDYDGVYFTIQALRLYHPEILSDVEFIVIDNNPAGPCAKTLKALESHIPNYRYVPHADKSGTTVRDLIFDQSNGKYVLCMDCHVFVVPGALKKLLEHFDTAPDTIDLLQGPLLYDNLTSMATHFQPEWNEGMYGHWAMDDAGSEIDAKPFDIPMQGLGLFACKRSAWPGFSQKFSGFGGEEGYIHEKFRQAGGRTLCLPFLRWVHRFDRPLGIPYRNNWEDRIRNYLIGFSELGLDTAPVRAHFGEFLGQDVADRIIAPIDAELEHSQ